MLQIKTCVLVAIGTEVVENRIQDTNTKYLEEWFANRGVRCLGRYFVVDDEPYITNLVLSLQNQADCIVFCGGLGATPDDCTREAVATAMGTTLRIDPAHFEKVKQIYQGWRVPLPEMAYKQAQVPVGAELLPNECGTAVGFVMTAGSSVIAALPGVPREMEQMFQQALVSWLHAHTVMPGHQVRQEWLLYGISETEVGQILAPWMMADANPQVGVYVTTGTIQVVITAQGDSEEEAMRRLSEVREEIRPLLREWLYSEDGVTLQELAVNRLRQSQTQLILQDESGIGALVLTALAAVPGGTDVIKGAFVGAYAFHESKRLLLDKEWENGVVLLTLECTEMSDVVCTYRVTIQEQHQRRETSYDFPPGMYGLPERVMKAVLREISLFAPFSKKE